MRNIILAVALAGLTAPASAQATHPEAASLLQPQVWLDSLFGPPETVPGGTPVHVGALLYGSVVNGVLSWSVDSAGTLIYDETYLVSVVPGDTFLTDLWVGPFGGPVFITVSESVWFLPDSFDFVIWDFWVIPQPWVQDRPSPAPSPSTPAATIVRGVLYLQVDRRQNTGAGHDPIPSGESGLCPKPVLLDIAGRKVLDLLPGPNDVRRLAPGVYFVRSEPSAVSREPSAFRKVVIQR
jgi:hypothetical protein